MKNFKDKSVGAPGKAKPALAEKNTAACHLPAADGQPSVELPQANAPHLVTMGCDAAVVYLDGGYNDESLAATVARMRSLAPAQYWPDIEAGFMARIEQRLRADVGGREHCPVGLGNSTMMSLHTAAVRVAALATVGAIVPASAQGQEQLRQLEALSGSISWVGALEPRGVS